MLRETSFLLPKINEIFFKQEKKSRLKTLPLLGFHEGIEQTKNKISTIKYKKWTNLRKLANDFEFPCVSKMNRPISRAFFKLVEILIDHKLDTNCDTLHLAESPGGFIEACMNYKNRMYNQVKTLYTFSLNSENLSEVPTYSEKIIKNKHVSILSNEKNQGDLYSIKNIEFLSMFFRNKQIKFITCDGGFAEKNDFSAKETLHHKLIFHQIVASIFVLENNGSLVIKFFDIFTELSFDFVYLLSYLFQKVYVSKPHTSRPTNSERYIVCKFFSKSRFLKIKDNIKTLTINGIENYGSLFDKNKLNKEYIKRFKEINTQLVNFQIYSIENILNIHKLNLKFPPKSQENIKKWRCKYIDN